MKRKVLEMWRIHDVLFLTKEKAEQAEDGKEVVRKVYVGIEEDLDLELISEGESMDYFGSWIFDDEESAQSDVDYFNDHEPADLSNT